MKDHHPLHNNNFNLLRILAATQVLIVHIINHFEFEANFFTSLVKATPGVPLFFFISGFLIGKTYIKKKELGNKVFFLNRAIRIYPALIVCVIITTSMLFFTDYLDGFTDWNHFIIWVIGQITFGQIYNPDFMREFGEGVFNGALWTIVVELQFYVITPILFWLIGRPKKFMFVLLAVISLSINIYFRLFLNWESLIQKFVYASFLPWIYMYMIGFVVARYQKIKDKVMKVPFSILVVLYAISMLFIGHYENNAENGINPISVLILSCMALKFAYSDLRIPFRINRIIQKYDLSYGVYIYHMPIINFLIYLGLFSLAIKSIVAIILAFTLAYFSWQFVESPILKYKRG